MNLHARLTEAMIEYEKGGVNRIEHFLKVYGYAKTIGELEKLDHSTQFILEAASLVHDIGIKSSLEKYGSSAGEYQELEGPIAARPMLETLGFESPDIDRICYLIAHHHTYSDIDGLDYQILVEADFLVNIREDEFSMESIQNVYDRIFKTGSGKHFLKALYLP